MGRMLVALLAVLMILWLLGYITPAGFLIPAIPLFVLNGRTITLYDLLILAIVLWVISLLPEPFQLIAGLLIILWILSTLGIIAFAGLSNLLILAIILGIVLSLLSALGP